MGRATRHRTAQAAGYGLGVVASALLTVGALTGHGELDLLEVLGFISGAVSVWLTVLENVWLWPVSIANNIFFLVLFGRAQLFADASLQVVYVILEILGWYWWLRGGDGRSALRIVRTRIPVGVALAGATAAGTVVLTGVLARVDDTAPFLDALTTSMSLTATYMLSRKLIENWWVWMAADVIYVGLYVYKQLVLTAVLYAVFLGMCIVGLRHWQQVLRNPEPSRIAGMPAGDAVLA